MGPRGPTTQFQQSLAAWPIWLLLYSHSLSTYQPSLDNSEGNLKHYAKSLQLCPTPCDPTDCSLSGSSVQGILQARLQEWVVISSSIRHQTFHHKKFSIYPNCKDSLKKIFIEV
ncbi:unnamed protein product [Rangifer tarandus platyrhynchus]|uniref:Uncharacterized protein n=1 Tax=Rangifer tarandus platyrhynchus TaxID=3082113 RepID=A0AC59ZNN7_RANTA